LQQIIRSAGISAERFPCEISCIDWREPEPQSQHSNSIRQTGAEMTFVSAVKAHQELFPDDLVHLLSASEQHYFLGAHVAHVVEYEQWLREKRRRQALASTRRAHATIRGPVRPMNAMTSAFGF
jgi:hypothetical protein